MTVRPSVVQHISNPGLRQWSPLTWLVYFMFLLCSWVCIVYESIAASSNSLFNLLCWSKREQFEFLFPGLFSFFKTILETLYKGLSFWFFFSSELASDTHLNAPFFPLLMIVQRVLARGFVFFLFQIITDVYMTWYNIFFCQNIWCQHKITLWALHPPSVSSAERCF